MTKHRIRLVISKSFLTLAYISVALQWGWVLAVGLPQLIETGAFDSFVQTAPQEPEAPTQPTEFSPVLAIVAGVITLIFLLLTAFILIRLPKAISTTGDRIVHQTTEAIIPVITHHKKIPAKKKRFLTKRIIIVLQLLLILLPLAASFFIPPVQTITSQIITTLAIWLAGCSVICFVLSWLTQPSATSQTRSRASRG